MRIRMTMAAMLFATMLVGCAATPDQGELVASLLEADTEFARQSVQHGAAAAFDQYVADDAVSLPATTDANSGRTAIVDSLRALDSGWVLDWTPVHASVSDDGSLGYTWGRFALYRKDTPDSKVVGKYVNVWRRGPQDIWRVIADIRNQKPPAYD